MIHRHLDYPTGTPVGELPVAAVVDILDRGDLDDWQPLAAEIARSAITQVELAERMGISQSDLSKLERRRDLRLSTLDSYLRAAGGNLRVVVEMPGGETEIDIGSLAR